MHAHQRLAWQIPLVCLFSLALGFCCQRGTDDKPRPKPPTRQLLYPEKLEDVAVSIRPFVRKLLAPEQGPINAADAKPAGVFVRLVAREYLLDGKALRKGSTLGGTPFVFTTLPEAFYGRTLLQVFSTIGYSAEDVLTGQLAKEKVVVVFRWEKKVVIHAGRDGNLSDPWHSAVYSTTWDNLFALVAKMASDKDWHYVKKMDKPPILTKLQLKSPKEGQFLLGFPDAGKQRLKSTCYHTLRDVKGADWEYRQFLERSMSATEHFSGDGTSKPTIIGPGKPPVGFPEFLGPNREVTDLPEVAVIRLGALRVAE